MKRGQVTIFVILGIVIMVMLGLFLFAKNKIQEQKVDDAFTQVAQSSGTDKVVLFVDLCFEEAISKSLEEITANGGYSKEPDLFLEVLGIKIPYYLYNGKILLPDIKDVEKDTDEKIIYNYKKCINNFEVFDQSEFMITAQEPILESNYDYDFVEFKLNHRMKIQTGEIVYERDYFEKTRNSKLRNAYDSARKIVDIQRQLPPGQVSVYDLFDESITKDFEPNFVSFGLNGTVFVLESIETGELFTFATK